MTAVRRLARRSVKATQTFWIFQSRFFRRGFCTMQGENHSIDGKEKPTHALVGKRHRRSSWQLSLQRVLHARTNLSFRSLLVIYGWENCSQLPLSVQGFVVSALQILAVVVRFCCALLRTVGALQGALRRKSAVVESNAFQTVSVVVCEVRKSLNTFQMPLIDCLGEETDVASVDFGVAAAAVQYSSQRFVPSARKTIGAASIVINARLVALVRLKHCSAFRAATSEYVQHPRRV